MSTRAVIILFLALMLAAPAAASERYPTLAELEHEVMCPTCKTLLELSHAPVAERMRVFIRARISAGETKSEIKAQLVDEFGEGVLAAPPTHGFGLLAWALPIFGLLAAGSVVAVIAWRWRQATEAETVADGPPESDRIPLDAALERRIDQELTRYDS